MTPPWQYSLLQIPWFVGICHVTLTVHQTAIGTNYDHDPIRDPIPDLIPDPIRDPIRDPIPDLVRDPARDPVRDLVRDPFRDPGCLPFTKKIRKFRLECKWKD